MAAENVDISPLCTLHDVERQANNYIQATTSNWRAKMAIHSTSAVPALTLRKHFSLAVYYWRKILQAAATGRWKDKLIFIQQQSSNVRCTPTTLFWTSRIKVATIHSGKSNHIPIRKPRSHGKLPHISCDYLEDDDRSSYLFKRQTWLVICSKEALGTWYLFRVGVCVRHQTRAKARPTTSKSSLRFRRPKPSR